jgi:hypothetical protein
MIAYQVYKGDENKHGFQNYELQATYLNKEKALEHAQKIVDETPLFGDVLVDHGWRIDGKYRDWTAQGWSFVCICRIEQIDIIE